MIIFQALSAFQLIWNGPVVENKAGESDSFFVLSKAQHIAVAEAPLSPIHLSMPTVPYTVISPPVAERS